MVTTIINFVNLRTMSASNPISLTERGIQVSASQRAATALKAGYITAARLISQCLLQEK